MVDPTPHRQLLSLACLAAALVPAPGLTAPWQCGTLAGGAWDCAAAAPRVLGPPGPVQLAEAAPAGPATPATGQSAPSGTPKEDGRCGPPPVGVPTPPRDMRPAAGETRIRADQVAGTEQRFVLEGDVVIERGDERLRADTVLYDKRRNRAEAEGNVTLRQPGLEIHGSSGYTQIRGEHGEFNDIRYELPDYNARGEAKRIERVDASVSRLEQATYTTCPAERRDWTLKSGNVKLDQDAGVGTARHVRLELKGVPVLYAPWLSFPIDRRRKSGFLLPSVGSGLETGTDVRIPYYWNIAPNRDATIAPRYMEKRGVQLQGEYRYLYRSGEGELRLAHLPDDDLFGDDRSLASYRHQGRIRHLRIDADLNHATDDRYFEDLGDSLSLSSITHLERRLDLRYSYQRWSLLGRLQGFQPMAGARESYRRLPQLLARADIPSRGRPLVYHAYAEAVSFEHAEDPVTGTRLDLKPGISMELLHPAWSLIPTLSLRHTRYALAGTQPGQPQDPSRTTPIFSVDGTLFLERDARLGGRDYLQTLEPRLYYLYVPFEDQDDLPRFDTARLDFGFAQLFRDNRFSGADRQGDANQLGLALTTRYLDRESARERLRAGIGQIIYFRDRDVTLGTADDPQTADRSSLIGEISAAVWSHARAEAGLQWDPHRERAEKGVLSYHYERGRRRIFNAAYRYRRNDLEQTDVSLLWPLGRRWHALARWNYSLRDERTLEAFAGLEYDACCWAVRLVGRQYVNDVEGDENQAIYLQLVLKGLGRLGEDIDTLLERAVLGYRPQTDVE